MTCSFHSVKVSANPCHLKMTAAVPKTPLRILSSFKKKKKMLMLVKFAGCNVSGPLWCKGMDAEPPPIGSVAYYRGSGRMKKLLGRWTPWSWVCSHALLSKMSILKMLGKNNHRNSTANTDGDFKSISGREYNILIIKMSKGKHLAYMGLRC